MSHNIDVMVEPLPFTDEPDVQLERVLDMLETITRKMGEAQTSYCRHKLHRGDVLISLLSLWGSEVMTAAMEGVGISESVAAQERSVSARLDASLRRPDVFSYRVHRYVAYLPPEHRLELLDQAEAMGKTTLAEVRELYADLYRGTDAPQMADPLEPWPRYWRARLGEAFGDQLSPALLDDIAGLEARVRREWEHAQERALDAATRAA